MCAAYDTETCNLHAKGEWCAYTVCYQINDLRGSDISSYEPGISDDVRIYRSATEVIEYIEGLISWALDSCVVPVVAGYNLLFDMQPILAALRAAHPMNVNAQSSTNVYTLDLCNEKGAVLLRFWDTFHLEMGGLSAMGETAGLAKLKGDWDYDKVRTPETPLTADEIGYATRDVQVIPAYLRYLLSANEWLKPCDFGFKVLTKTSLVRQMAKNEVSRLKPKGSRRTLGEYFAVKCHEDLPRCYYDYGLRKACFRGGLTFTAAAFASVVVANVASLDVTSMHHTFINGSLTPEGFRPVSTYYLNILLERVFATDIESLLGSYHNPFKFAFHARVRFEGLRLKPGTPFDDFGIALIPRAKFGKSAEHSTDYTQNDAARFAEEAARAAGWRDRAYNPVFAFGKLYSCEWCELHISEYEAWCISRVYTWDSCAAILGEATAKVVAPPDYVTLQSNIYYARKNDMKRVCNIYKEGEPYPEKVPESIPAGIAEELARGSLSRDFAKAYYGSTVKGSFNSIYGTQAQDVFKPGYIVDDAAIIDVDRASVLSQENFFDLLPSKSNVMYTYGLRIVGRSRAHLVIAIELLYRKFGRRVRVTGGDTDSIKCSCDADVSDVDLATALEPLAIASKAAIGTACGRIRRDFPSLARTLEGVGSFDIEGCSPGRTRYAHHMECWNKARVSIDFDGAAHVTAAGVSRPRGVYHIADYIHDYISLNGPETLPDIMGYNVYIPPYLAHSLQRSRPLPFERFSGRVTDYLGQSSDVDAPLAVALWPCGRWLGETDMPSNRENVEYLERVYDREVRLDMRSLNMKEGVPTIENDW